LNFLAIGAHPDDVELGCFGTLLEKKRQGHKVLAVALSPGAYRDYTAVDIERVWENARSLLRRGPGKADYVLGNFPNGNLQQDWSTVKFVDDLIREHEIDAIVTHHYGEAHQDHVMAQRIAVSAARRHVGSLWLWESSIYTHRNVFPFRPQLYVGVSAEAFEAKMEALQHYVKAGMLDRGEAEAHRHLARYRGAETREEYAEAFEVVWELHPC